MPDLCLSCGVEPAKPRMRVCRFCDSVGWRPLARPAAPADPVDPALVSPWWEILTVALCALAGVLLVIFIRLNA